MSLFSRNFNSNMSYSSCRKLGGAKKKNQEKRAKISMQFLRSQISFKGRPGATRESTYWRETISLRSVRKTFPNKTSPDFSHDGAHEIVCNMISGKGKSGTPCENAYISENRLVKSMDNIFE